MGVVLLLKGANTNEVVGGIKGKIAAPQRSLPPGVSLQTVYDQSDLIQKAVQTVSKARS